MICKRETWSFDLGSLVFVSLPCLLLSPATSVSGLTAHLLSVPSLPLRLSLVIPVSLLAQAHPWPFSSGPAWLAMPLHSRPTPGRFPLSHAYPALLRALALVARLARNCLLLPSYALGRRRMGLSHVTCTSHARASPTPNPPYPARVLLLVFRGGNNSARPRRRRPMLMLRCGPASWPSTTGWLRWRPVILKPHRSCLPTAYSWHYSFCSMHRHWQQSWAR